jgi:hypothetical protein
VIGFTGLLFIVLFVLKLGVGDTAVETWSWWWVTAPLWVGVALWAAFMLLAAFLTAIGRALMGKEKRNRVDAAKALRKYGESLR